MMETHIAVGIGQSLGVSAVMVALTVVIHFFGLAILLAMMAKPAGPYLHDRLHVGLRVGAVLAAVFGLFVLHTVEIWLYAALYRFALQALPDFETALYFSTVSFVSIGYGDVVLPRQWRLVGAIEGANGVILLGWSTAFLISVIGRVRAFDHDWLDGRKR
jgi:voltage-gated potassium channel Kch